MIRSVIAVLALLATGHAIAQVVSLACKYDGHTKPVTYMLDLSHRSGSVHYNWNGGGGSYSANSVKPDPGMITIRYEMEHSQGWDTISRTDLTARSCSVSKNAMSLANGYCSDGTCTLLENPSTKF